MTKRRISVTARSAAHEVAARRESYEQHLDAQLDEALEETFPASDPIAVTPRRARGKPSRGASAAEKRATSKPPTSS